MADFGWHCLIRCCRLIARSPLHDTAVETDMMKHTVPSTTRGSTHSSSLTSSHPTSAASSDRSSSQPAVTGSFPHFATGSAHPSLISSSHFPTGSIQEFVHVPQGLPSGNNYILCKNLKYTTPLWLMASSINTMYSRSHTHTRVHTHTHTQTYTHKVLMCPLKAILFYVSYQLKLH